MSGSHDHYDQTTLAAMVVGRARGWVLVETELTDPPNVVEGRLLWVRHRAICLDVLGGQHWAVAYKRWFDERVSDCEQPTRVWAQRRTVTIWADDDPDTRD